MHEILDFLQLCTALFRTGLSSFISVIIQEIYNTSTLG